MGPSGARIGANLVALGGLAFLALCERPTHNRLALKAVKADSQLLMANHPIMSPMDWAEIPRSQEPAAIARLQPYAVIVDYWGVDILMKPGFDGGWG
jgi:hypothetical protein